MAATNEKRSLPKYSDRENGIGIVIANVGLVAISKDGTSWQVSKPNKINNEYLYLVQIRISYVVFQGENNFYVMNLDPS
jgi:hypothetical protein